MANKFLLCFHDYSVWNFKKVTPILYKLRDLAGGPFSVLVIPDTSAANKSLVQEFRETLWKLHDEGFELALHGYRHRAKLSPDRSYRGLFEMKLTNGEAEFSGLCKHKSKKLLKQAISAWDTLLNSERPDYRRIHPAAFIPPTWYGNPSLPNQVRKANMHYESRFALTPIIGYPLLSPVVSFAGIPRAAEKIAFLFGRLMLKTPFGYPRIALHPSDFPRLKKPIQELIKKARSSGKIMFYRDI
ncbi:MAG: DUF2334 domain-containing protein [Fibrobacter sp.]|nr:DUF2334 domain-containing protein [Fibrobacter sp.]